MNNTPISLIYCCPLFREEVTYGLNDDGLLECYGHYIRVADFDGTNTIIYAAKGNTYNNFKKDFIPFTDEQHEIFYSLRQKEIDRLKEFIQKQQTYIGKVRAFYEMKAGEMLLDYLQVYSNDFLRVAYNKQGSIDNTIYAKRYTIDLSPAYATNEIGDLNNLVKGYLLKAMNEPITAIERKIPSYDGFRKDEAVKLFEAQLTLAYDKSLCIKQKINEIEQAGISDLIIGKYPDFGREQFTTVMIESIISKEQYFEFWKWLKETEKLMVLENSTANEESFKTFCQCIKKVQDKYVAIGNEAMNGMKLMPITGWNEEEKERQKIISDRIKKASIENSDEYYLELIGLQHSKDCKGMAEIEAIIANDKKLLEINKQTLNTNAFKSEMETLKQKWVKQKERANNELQKWVTSRLGKISGNSLFSYWNYVNSVKHINLYSAADGFPQRGFNHSIIDTQFDQLTTLINDIKLFAKLINKEQVRCLFDLTLNEPIQVSHNPSLAWLFNRLKIASFISDGWQSTIEKNRLFIGKHGRIIKAKALSKYIGEASQTDEKIKRINKTIEAL